MCPFAAVACVETAVATSESEDKFADEENALPRSLALDLKM